MTDINYALHHDMKYRIRISGPDIEFVSEAAALDWYDKLQARIDERLESAKVMLELLYPDLTVEVG